METPLSPAIPIVPVLEPRKAFAIDEAADEDDEDDVYAIGDDDEEDEQMMDEVDAFLEANDKGLTDEQNDAAKGKIFFQMCFQRTDVIIQTYSPLPQ